MRRDHGGRAEVGPSPILLLNGFSARLLSYVRSHTRIVRPSWTDSTGLHELNARNSPIPGGSVRKESTVPVRARLVRELVDGPVDAHQVLHVVRHPHVRHL